MVTRIGGLASGMDIDGLVEKLMTAEKAPLNKLYQQKQKYEWQRDAYRDVNKQLASFDKFLRDEMTLQRDFYKKSATSSNDAAVSVTANASASGTLTIDKIDQLATAGKGLGVVEASKRAKTTTLASLGVASDANGKIDIKMKVLQNDGSMKEINKTFKTSDTIQSVVEGLNKDTGLNAFYDEATGQFTLTTQATGKGVNYNGSDTSAYVQSGQDLFTKLGFNSDVLTSGGQDAVLTVNGANITRSSNTFEINGYNVTLKDKYSEAKPITLTATTDADAMVDKIKKFVETYNGLVESLNNLTTEKKYRDYLPLTEEQKADLKEKEIEKWEEKAKSGVLRSDSIVRSAVSSMRGIMYEKGGSSNPLIDTLTEMGITTTKAYLDGGKLEINEDKLREAIAADPQAVSDTFTKSLENGNGGIIQKLRGSIQDSVATIEKKAGKATMTEENYSIGKSLIGVDDRIDAWKVKLANIEQRYWKQFTAMEKAINKSNQQSSLFMQGSGGGF